MGVYAKGETEFRPVVLCPAAVFGPSKRLIGSVDDLNQSNSMFWKVFCNVRKDSKLPK